MYVGMTGPTQHEQPGQNYGNRVRCIDAVDNETENVKQDR